MFRSILALSALLIPFSIYAQVKFISPANGAHGSALPATCNVGDQFELTSASNQSQWNLCTATNTWTAQGGAIGAAGGSLSGTYPNPTTIDINHTTIPTNSSADQTVVTTAPATGSWQPLPNCQDSGGNHLNYNTSTHTFTCGNTGGTVGSVAFSGVTASTNTGNTLTVGSGSTVIAASGGIVDANRVNDAVVPASATVLGTNASAQAIAAAVQGNGSKVQLSTGTTTSGHCVQFDASGNTTDAGAACGTGGGGGTVNFPTGSISGSSLTLFSNCTTAGAPCNLSRGQGIIDQVSATNTVPSPGSGSDTIYVYWTSSGCVIGSDTGVSITTTGAGPCAGTSTQGITSFPGSTTAAVLKATYNAGVWTAVYNYAPALVSPPTPAVGTGLTQALNGQTVTTAIDTSAASIGTGTANYVARWNGNNYTLSTGLFYDDGTKSGAGGVPDNGYAFQVVGNTTGSIYAGIENKDTTNSGLSNLCLLVNGGVSFTCLFQKGSAASTDPKSFNLSSAGDFIFFNSVPSNTEVTRIYNAGGIKTAGSVQIKVYTVATLPVCNAGNGGMISAVSDAASPTYNATLTGGGTGASASIPVFCNGTNWTAH